MENGKTGAVVASLEIVSELPPMPMLVLSGDVLSHIDRLVLIGQAKAVTTAEQAEVMGKTLLDALDTERSLESRRMELKRPLLDLGNRIDALTRTPKDKLAGAIRSMRSLLQTFQRAEQERKDREAQARQDELNRLERERVAAIEQLRKEAVARENAIAQAKKDAEEVERKAVEDAKATAAAAALAARTPAAPAAEADDMDILLVEDPVVAAREKVNALVVEQAAFALAGPAGDANIQAIEQKQAIILAAPVAVMAKPAGITFRTVLKMKVVDVSKLRSPYSYLVANEPLIRTNYCTGYKDGDPLPVLDGVRFIVDKQPVDARRGGR